jgi:hypothetical protein
MSANLSKDYHESITKGYTFSSPGIVVCTKNRKGKQISLPPFQEPFL